MKRSLTKRLWVFIHGDHTGDLLQSGDGAHSFVYASDWLDRKDSFPLSLLLPLRSDAYRGEVVRHYFDNLLPDNPDIRAKSMPRFQVVSSQLYDIIDENIRDKMFTDVQNAALKLLHSLNG